MKWLVASVCVYIYYLFICLLWLEAAIQWLEDFFPVTKPVLVHILALEHYIELVAQPQEFKEAFV